MNTVKELQLVTIIYMYLLANLHQKLSKYTSQELVSLDAYYRIIVQLTVHVVKGSIDSTFSF